MNTPPATPGDSNKGVGFKAVYQVTDTPEISSAAEASPTSVSVSADFGVGIALEQDPFRESNTSYIIAADGRPRVSSVRDRWRSSAPGYGPLFWNCLQSVATGHRRLGSRCELDVT